MGGRYWVDVIDINWKVGTEWEWEWEALHYLGINVFIQ